MAKIALLTLESSMAPNRVFESEEDYFAEQAAGLDIVSAVLPGESPVGHSLKYLSYRAFVRDAIGLLEAQFPPEASAWYGLVARAAAGEASQEELMHMFKEVLAYRQHKLGIVRMVPDRVSSEDAVTMLFLYGLAQFPAPETQRVGLNVALDVDRFASEFLRAFGRARELIDLLKLNFHLA